MIIIVSSYSSVQSAQPNRAASEEAVKCHLVALYLGTCLSVTGNF